MPRAIVSKLTERFDLESIPVEDGQEKAWVELRRMSFGEKMEKDAEALKMKFKQGDGKEDPDAEVAMVSAKANILEIQRCIIDHNLEDDGDPPKKLNLKDPNVIRMLDPRVGQEISNLIGDMNDFEKKAQKDGTDAKGK